MFGGLGFGGNGGKFYGSTCYASTAGSQNTGGGGGGGDSNSNACPTATKNGKSGGSGIVIIKYKFQ